MNLIRARKCFSASLSCESMNAHTKMTVYLPGKFPNLNFELSNFDSFLLLDVLANLFAQHSLEIRDNKVWPTYYPNKN